MSDCNRLSVTFTRIHNIFLHHLQSTTSKLWQNCGTKDYGLEFSLFQYSLILVYYLGIIYIYIERERERERERGIKII